MQLDPPVAVGARADSLVCGWVGGLGRLRIAASADDDGDCQRLVVN
jgi:hypothetical protein